MSKRKKRRIFQSNNEVGHVQRSMFVSWAFSIIIPIVLIIVVNILTYGSHAVDMLTKPDFFNDHIYQLEELNSGEYFRKIVDNYVIDSPNEEEMISFIDGIIDEHDFLSEPDRFNKMILLVRKGEETLVTKVIGQPLTDAESMKFDGLPDDILPDFKPGRETNNETLFHETGYVIDYQQDFYYADGSEGSVFSFHKYTNIPGKIVSSLGKNLALVMLFMFLIHMVMAYFMMKRVTKPVGEIVKATEEVSVGNYAYQIPLDDPDKGIGRQPFLGSISESINTMIIELDKGKKVQDKNDSMRSQFIANVSHDMKTPLTSIKIHAQAIKDGIVSTPEKMERYLDNILRKSDDMDSMLDELKIYNELELGTGNYRMQSINFKDFIEDVVEELQYDVSSDNIHLNLETYVEECTLEFDPKKIKRVLNNITFNAVKYAEIRPLKINYSLTEAFVNGAKSIQLRIEDNGVGVAEEEYNKLFIQHYRVDPARNQTISGSGLGLTIAESIIKHHGGCISAEKSTLGGLAIIINLNSL